MPSAVRSRLASAGGSPIVPVAWIVAPFTPASTAAIASPSALRRNRPLTLNAPLGSRSRVSADSSERSDPVAATVQFGPDAARQLAERSSDRERRPPDADLQLVEEEPPAVAAEAAREVERSRRQPHDTRPRPDHRGIRSRGLDLGREPFGAQQLLQSAARRRRDAPQGAAQLDAHRVVLRRQPAFGAERTGQRGLQAEDRQRHDDVRTFDLQVDVRSAERHRIVDASAQREGRRPT